MNGVRANAKPAPCSQRAHKSHIPLERECSRLNIDKREWLLACAAASALTILGDARPTLANDGYVNMEALKGKDYGKPAMMYPDYELTPEGLQYKDLKVGKGRILEEGDSIVLDWQGFTVGYYGRVFEARNKAKGGSFEGNDKDFLRIQYGKAQLIPGVQLGLAGMKQGGIRRLIIPEGLGYPNADFKNWGPSPETFAGKRTLDFVLKNQGMIDKTLLIDVELLKIV